MSTEACPRCQAPHETGPLPSGAELDCACGAHLVLHRNRLVSAPWNVLREPVESEPTVLRPSGGGAAALTVPGPVTDAVALPGLELLELVGRGGMGEVWRARQTSLGRMVAVKLLPPRLARDPEFVSRFEREAAALAQLNHPNIIQIIDRGVAGDHYYFVMEYVEGGGSLRDALGRGPLAPQEALRVALQVARALECAHDGGVVHRDLKPDNVLLDARGHAKVADFGLAGMQRADSKWNLTASAVAMGTLNYMAPEQRRDARSVDGRADLYALGVVLYELLCGEVPVGRFKLPSQRVPGLDPRVDALVGRLLEAEPDARYPRAADVARALEPLVHASAAPERRPPTRAGRRALRLGWRRARTALAVVGVLALAGLAGRALLRPAPAPAAAQAPAPVYPPNTDRKLFVGGAGDVKPGATGELTLDFSPGTEELNAWAGAWRLEDGWLRVVQAGSDSGGGRLIPRTYLARRYFSSDDFSAQVLMDVRPLPAGFTAEEDAQHFGELAFRIKDLQVSAFAIPGVGMRLSWRYSTPDGEEVVGNSAQDLENLVEDEMPVPARGPFLVRLALKRRKAGVEVQAFVNGQRFARKLLPGLQGRTGKVALGCRNLACEFDDLVVRGQAVPRPVARPDDTAE